MNIAYRNTVSFVTFQNTKAEGILFPNIPSAKNISEIYNSIIVLRALRDASRNYSDQNDLNSP